MWKKILIFAGVFVFNVAAFAEESVELSLQASTTNVTVGQAFDISLEAKYAGQGNLNIGDEAIPGMENFQILGRSSSTNIQMINGDHAAISTTTFNVKAKSEGTFSLGPVMVNLQDVTNNTNEQVNSNALTITVGPAALADNEESNSMGEKTLEETRNLEEIDWYWFLGGLFGFLLIMFFLRKKSSKERVENNGAHGLLNAKALGSSMENREAAKDRAEVSRQKEESVGRPSEAPNVKSEKFYFEAREYLMSLLEKKYGKVLGTYSNAEILEFLENEGERETTKIREILNDCENGQFSPLKPDKNVLLEKITSITS